MIEYDINKRWENGTPHHPESVKLFKRLAEIDYGHAGDAFCWKSGGDGDNGETLMYELDILFEERDEAEAKSSAKQSPVFLSKAEERRWKMWQERRERKHAKR